MPRNSIDLALDSLTWIACASLPTSLTAEMLQNPTSAFFAGSIASGGLLALIGIAKFRTELRSLIAYRIALVITGVVLGLVA